MPWKAVSRGLRVDLAGPGAISPYTLARVAALGIDCGEAQPPAPCAVWDLTDADLVIALKEDEHRPMLAERFAGWEDRVNYWHVHDIDQVKPEDALDEIEQLVRDLVRELKEKDEVP
jgi:protein-tyrosine phosphatase